MITLGSSQKCTFQASILSQKAVFPENRFGISLQLCESFKYRMIHTVRNQQAVRARYEIEWQTAEQSQKANQFLYGVISNKEIIRHATTRTELRPLPAQWKHLMKKMKKLAVFDDYIQISHCKCPQNFS